MNYQLLNFRKVFYTLALTLITQQFLKCFKVYLYIHFSNTSGLKVYLFKKDLNFKIFNFYGECII